MKIRLNDDYYFWCCEWCDSENRVLWARLQDEVYCGACHRPAQFGDSYTQAQQTRSLPFFLAS